MTYTLEWQEVAEETERLSVPGGWLYRHVGDGSLAFVPQPPFAQAPTTYQDQRYQDPISIDFPHHQYIPPARYNPPTYNPNFTPQGWSNT
jgi:hypothetical protein